MEGAAVVSSEVIASYAADAALEVEGVDGIAATPLHRQHGVRVTDRDDGGRALELHLTLAWGAPAPEVGVEVQERVAAYLERMLRLRPVEVAVVVDAFSPPAD